MPAATTLIFPNELTVSCWINSVEPMLPMPWGSHKAPVRLERRNGTMNRAAFCVADDFFDTVQNILAAKGLAYGVQEPFDNASEQKNTLIVFNPQLSQQTLHGAPSANVQAISSQLRSPERETCGAKKPDAWDCPIFVGYVFLQFPSGSGMLAETHGPTGLVQCERWMAIFPDHLRNAPKQIDRFQVMSHVYSMSQYLYINI